jgi:hypothetical protein
LTLVIRSFVLTRSSSSPVGYQRRPSAPLCFSIWECRRDLTTTTISSAAYSHDFYSLGLGFAIGVEVGVADRFGHYELCCNTVIKSSGLANSGEIWAGPRFRHEGFVLFDTIRIAGAITTGLSFASDSIGREREREIAWSGSARTLIYFGPEITLSLVNYPDWEFVYREHHRSGANATFGHLREGYNANVFGVRYKF